MDPILAYLLEFNQLNSVEYSDRYLIPPGGLAKMLESFREFRLNRIEVIKSDLVPAAKSAPEHEETLEELYELI